MEKNKVIKCKLSTCLNCEKKKCTLFVPSIIRRIIPNSIKCPYFDDDFEKTIKEYKARGGTIGAVIRMKGKLTEEEAKKIKKDKRKTRSDKGKKRKPKKENTLKELF